MSLLSSIKNRSELLIYGYIKNIHNNVIIGVIHIISDFYGSNYDDLFIAIFAETDDGLGCVMEFDVTKKMKQKVYKTNIFCKEYSNERMYCVNDNNIYEVGNKLGNNFKYSIETNKKISLPDNIVPRGGGGLVYSNKHGLIVIGGLSGSIYSNGCERSMEILKTNASKWKNLSPMITKKSGLACCLFNDDYIFECGGVNWDSSMTTQNPFGNFLDTRSLYNINNNKWKPLKSMNHSRRSCVAAHDYIKNRIIVGGDPSFNKSMECYELNNNIWIDMPQTIYNHWNKTCLFVQNNGTIIIGSLGMVAYNFERFDPRNNKWYHIDTLSNIIDADVKQMEGLSFLGKHR